MALRLTALLLATALATLAFARPAAAATHAERGNTPEPTLAIKVKHGIDQLGTGPDARISVRLHDGKRLEGYVGSSDDAGFTVVTKSGESREIQYGDVTQVKGQNLATGWKIAIGVGVGVGVFFLVLFVYLATHSG